jgi:hypothetical protein
MYRTRTEKSRDASPCIEAPEAVNISPPYPLRAGPSWRSENGQFATPPFS